MSLFIVGEIYSKKDIYEILKVPKEKQGGAWNTGYTRYNNDYYVFANIGVAGRTGHDYPNEIIDGKLNWYGKSKSHINQNTIKNMISKEFKVNIFYRYNNNDKFKYMGAGIAEDFKDTTPVNILWTFENDRSELYDNNIYNEGIVEEEEFIYEGQYITIRVNAYERNKDAREKCIQYHGTKCKICGFDFESFYGKIGKGFIHVHHIVPLHKIKKEYRVNPIKDLIPVCPNCHAMLHIKKSDITIDNLNNIINKRRKDKK